MKVRWPSLGTAVCARAPQKRPKSWQVRRPTIAGGHAAAGSKARYDVVYTVMARQGGIRSRLCGHKRSKAMLAPSAARYRAVASVKPLLAAVMTTTFQSMLLLMILPPGCAKQY